MDANHSIRKSHGGSALLMWRHALLPGRCDRGRLRIAKKAGAVAPVVATGAYAGGVGAAGGAGSTDRRALSAVKGHPCQKGSAPVQICSPRAVPSRTCTHAVVWTPGDTSYPCWKCLEALPTQLGQLGGVFMPCMAVVEWSSIFGSGGGLTNTSDYFDTMKFCFLSLGVVSCGGVVSQRRVLT